MRQDIQMHFVVFPDLCVSPFCPGTLPTLGTPTKKITPTKSQTYSNASYVQGLQLLAPISEWRRSFEPHRPPSRRVPEIKYGSPGQSMRDLRDRVGHGRGGHSDPAATLEEELLAEEAAAAAEAILAAASRGE